MSSLDAPPDHDAPADLFAVPAPLQPPTTDGRQSSAAEEARTIVSSGSIATLATLSEGGNPWASMVGYATLPDGRPVLMVSTLAEHGRNLQRDPRTSLSVVAPVRGRDPLDSGRVTLAGRVQQPVDEEAEQAEQAFIAAFPPAGMYTKFGDFTTWVLELDQVRWVGGYGRMDSSTVEQYTDAQPDPVVPSAGPAIKHLNDDHADALLDMARELAGFTDAESARCVAADRYGLDLVLATPRGRATARVTYAEPLDDAAGLRAATVALAKRARGEDPAATDGHGAGSSGAGVLGVILAVLVTVIALAAGPGVGTADAAKRYKRIVTLTPFTSNVVSRLGVSPIAIGGDVGAKVKLEPRAKKARRLAMAHPDGPNLEQLIRLKPDLLLSSPNWRTGSARIRRQHIDVIDGYEPVRLKTVTIGVELIAKKLGRTSKAGKIKTQIRRGIKRAKAGIKKRPKVLLVLGVGRATIAFLPNSWGGDLVSNAGGRLVTSGLKASFNAGIPGSFAPISDEEVLRRDPDVIVVVPHGTVSGIPKTIEYFKAKPGWKPTRAARNNQIYIADSDRLLQASDDPGAAIRYVRRSLLHN